MIYFWDIKRDLVVWNHLTIFIGYMYWIVARGTLVVDALNLKSVFILSIKESLKLNYVYYRHRVNTINRYINKLDHYP